MQEHDTYSRAAYYICEESYELIVGKDRKGRVVTRSTLRQLRRLNIALLRDRLPSLAGENLRRAKASIANLDAQGV